LDLIILGMYYGKRGHLAQFLVGLKDDVQEGEETQQYIPIAKVYSGLTDEERRQLNEQLLRHSIPGPGNNDRKFPNWIVDWKAKKDDLPDKWVLPSRSAILEVECSD